MSDKIKWCINKTGCMNNNNCTWLTGCHIKNEADKKNEPDTLKNFKKSVVEMAKGIEPLFTESELKQKQLDLLDEVICHTLITRNLTLRERECLEIELKQRIGDV